MSNAQAAKGALDLIKKQEARFLEMDAANGKLLDFTQECLFARQQTSCRQCSPRSLRIDHPIDHKMVIDDTAQMKLLVRALESVGTLQQRLSIATP